MLTAEMSKKNYYSSYIFIYSVVGCGFFSSFFLPSVAMVVDFMITINSMLLRTLKKLRSLFPLYINILCGSKGFFFSFFKSIFCFVCFSHCSILAIVTL